MMQDNSSSVVLALSAELPQHCSTFSTTYKLLQRRGLDRARAKPQCPLNCSDKSADWLLLRLTALFSPRTNS